MRLEDEFALGDVERLPTSSLISYIAYATALSLDPHRLQGMDLDARTRIAERLRAVGTELDRRIPARSGR